jgi:hypothetical protein
MKKRKSFLMIVVICFSAFILIYSQSEQTRPAEGSFSAALTQAATPQNSETQPQPENTATPVIQQTAVTPVNTAQSQTTIVPAEKVNRIIIESKEKNSENEIASSTPVKGSNEEPTKQMTAGTTVEITATEVPTEIKNESSVMKQSGEEGSFNNADYVLAERAGFLSDSFKEDGYIYDAEDREVLMQGLEAYVRITSEKPLKMGTEFLIYTDDVKVDDPITGHDMGRLIDVRGVGRVLEKTGDNLWRVKIIMSYDLIEQNYKIKIRNYFRERYNKVISEAKESSGKIEAYIIKVQNDSENIKRKDIVYLNKGAKDGLMPGQAMDVFSPIHNGETGIYHKIGKLLIINSMKDSAVAIITNQKSVIHVGYAVKSAE